MYACNHQPSAVTVSLTAIKLTLVTACILGNCSTLVDLYRINATAGDNRFNLMYWYQRSTNGTGALVGAAPNNYKPVGSMLNRLGAVVLQVHPNDGELWCLVVYRL